MFSNGLSTGGLQAAWGTRPRHLMKDTLKHKAYLPIPSLRDLCNSPDRTDRLQALSAMRLQFINGRPKSYLQLAAPLLTDKSDRCRWQASIVVGEFLHTDVELVWNVIEKFIKSGVNRGCDAVGTVIVEHLLAKDFSRYFENLKTLYSGGFYLSKELVEYCWPFGDAEIHWNAVEDFLKQETSAKKSYRRKSDHRNFPSHSDVALER